MKKPEFPKERYMCVEYLKKGFYEREMNFTKAVNALKKVKFDTIVCAGVSGMIFAPTLAYLLKKQLVIVRKSKAGHHSDRLIEANCSEETVGKCVFVDDLIDTGETWRRVVKKTNSYFCNRSEFVGAYLYDYGNLYFKKYLDRFN